MMRTRFFLLVEPHGSSTSLRLTSRPKAGCFTIVFLIISFMGVSHGVEQVSMFYSDVPQLRASKCYRI